MWKPNNFVKLLGTAIVCLVIAACGGSDPVDVSGSIVGTVYDSNNSCFNGYDGEPNH